MNPLTRGQTDPLVATLRGEVLGRLRRRLRLVDPLATAGTALFPVAPVLAALSWAFSRPPTSHLDLVSTLALCLGLVSPVLVGTTYKFLVAHLRMHFARQALRQFEAAFPPGSPAWPAAVGALRRETEPVHAVASLRRALADAHPGEFPDAPACAPIDLVLRAREDGVPAPGGPVQPEGGSRTPPLDSRGVGLVALHVQVIEPLRLAFLDAQGAALWRLFLLFFIAGVFAVASQIAAHELNTPLGVAGWLCVAPLVVLTAWPPGAYNFFLDRLRRRRAAEAAARFDEAFPPGREERALALEVLRLEVEPVLALSLLRGAVRAAHPGEFPPADRPGGHGEADPATRLHAEVLRPLQSGLSLANRVLAVSLVPPALLSLVVAYANATLPRNDPLPILLWVVDTALYFLLPIGSYKWLEGLAVRRATRQFERLFPEHSAERAEALDVLAQIPPDQPAAERFRRTLGLAYRDPLRTPHRPPAELPGAPGSGHFTP